MKIAIHKGKAADKDISDNLTPEAAEYTFEPFDGGTLVSTEHPSKNTKHLEVVTKKGM